MRPYACQVAEAKPLWGDLVQMALDAPGLVSAIRPGQFALVHEPGAFDPYLRRSAWFNGVEQGYPAFSLPADDPVAVRLRKGDRLEILAPLGHAAEWPDSAHHLLLAGEGAHVAQLLAIAQSAVRRGMAVALSMTPLPGQPFPAHLLPPEVEYHTGATVDRELVSWADVVFASGSGDWYRTLDECVRSVRFRLERGFMHALVDLAMPCGTGACMACAVTTAHGMKLTCTDGPWFDWLELEMQRPR